MDKKTLNANQMKISNEKLVLRKIRTGKYSRADLARETGLTRTTITLIVDRLIAKGVVGEGETFHQGVGRKPTILQLNKDAFYAIGVNIARAGIVVCVADFLGKIKDRCRIKYNADTKAEDDFEDICKKIQTYLSFYGKDDLLGIGVAAPGPLSSKSGVILSPPNFKKWREYPIADLLKQRFGCPVFLENNAKAKTMAEQICGAGRGRANFIDLVVEDGIGAGIVLNGELYRGANGFGGEIGHMSVQEGGELCDCGNKGCLELYASGKNILEYARAQGLQADSWKDIIDSAESDERARAVVSREAHYLAVALTGVINVLDIDTVIVSGNVLYDPSMLCRMIETEINANTITRNLQKVEVIPSELDREADFLAPVCLVLEDYFAED